MTANVYRVDIASKEKIAFGEGPHWDERNQVLYYVDSLDKGIVKLKLNGTQEYRRVNLDGKYITVVIPFSNGGEQFLVPNGNKLTKFDWATQSTEQLYELKDDICSFHDAKCDSRGRLWIGVIVYKGKEDVSNDILDAVENGKGFLGCFSCEKFDRKFVGLTIPNGLSFSPDERKLYHVDSLGHKIRVHDFDVANGILGEQKVVYKLDHQEFGFEKNSILDGMVTDVKGNLWVVIYLAGKVFNIDVETGKVINSITFDTPCTTSLCFGGKEIAHARYHGYQFSD